MAPSVEIEIGNKGADYVSIRVIEPALGGWMRADVEARCDGWTGKLKSNLRGGELPRFAGGDSVAPSPALGSATLEPLEPNITLEFTGSGRGHVAVQGIAQNTFASGTEPRFGFTIDQTCLKRSPIR